MGRFMATITVTYLGDEDNELDWESFAADADDAAGVVSMIESEANNNVYRWMKEKEAE